MDNESVSLPENSPVVVVETNESEWHIPDHAIRRMASFFLPKIQADLGERKSDESRPPAKPEA